MLGKLAGKKVLVLGGSGFLGSNIVRLAASLNAEVTGVSRRGPAYQSKPLHKAWALADIEQVSTYKQQIAANDIIIHSVGVLFDRTLGLKSVRPGEKGTYESINRDSLVALVDEAAKHQGKTVVYVSGEGHPPFFPRYQTTKEAAEKYLLECQKVKGAVIKPGVIYSWDHKAVSGPIALAVGFWGMIHPRLYKLFPERSYGRQFLDQFKVAQPVRLDAVVRAVLAAAVDQNCHGKVLLNSEIERLSQSL